jgi:WD40 repeat protein
MAFKAQASKYRHVSGKIVKKELWYPDLRINTSASDVTMVEASTKFIAVNWNSPAATLGILPVEQVGKRKGDPFVINAHSGQLADFKFSLFDDGLLATGSLNDDAVVNLWKIPEGGLTENLSQPFSALSGHRRSVDTLAFHPSAANVLARYHSLSFTLIICLFMRILLCYSLSSLLFLCFTLLCKIFISFSSSHPFFSCHLTFW